MLARLLYAAIGLCLLGTLPEHPGPRRTPATGVAAPAAAPPASAAVTRPVPEFAIPRIER